MAQKSRQHQSVQILVRVAPFRLETQELLNANPSGDSKIQGKSQPVFQVSTVCAKYLLHSKLYLTI